MRKPDSRKWMVGTIEHESEPVLIRHRLQKAEIADPNHQWLAVVTHHLAQVKANGLPEPEYNDSLQQLDESIIAALEPRPGDMVVLIETCHGKRIYYAYVTSYQSVGRSVQSVIDRFPAHSLSVRTALDPAWKFAARYITLLQNNSD